MSKNESTAEAAQARYDRAREALRNALASEQTTMIQAIQFAGRAARDGNTWHPAHDAGKRAVLEARLELCEASADLDAYAPAIVDLRATTRETLETAAAKLAAIVDPAPPTLEGVDADAIAAHAQATVDRDVAIAANLAARKAIGAALIQALRAIDLAYQAVRAEARAESSERRVSLFSEATPVSCHALLKAGAYREGKMLTELERVARHGVLTVEGCAEAIDRLGSRPADTDQIRAALRQLDHAAQHHGLSLDAGRSGSRYYEHHGQIHPVRVEHAVGASRSL